MTVTSTEPTTPTLDELAPYPKTNQEATAEALIKYLAVHAYATSVTTTSPPGGASKEAMRIWWLEMSAVTAEYAVLALLEFLQDFHRDVADDAAREVWSMWEAGEMGGDIWSWLHARKIDPEVVERAAKESVANAAGGTQ
jgi:hypothetical protein